MFAVAMLVEISDSVIIFWIYIIFWGITYDLQELFNKVGTVALYNDKENNTLLLG